MFDVQYSEYFTNRTSLITDVAEQNKILFWIQNVREYGLSNPPKGVFVGKISPSWKNLDPKSPNYIFAQKHNLWHYHIGHEIYIDSPGGYKTSDWLVHFIWDKRNPKMRSVIKLVHYSSHKTLTTFPLPSIHML